jgi:hypothetical protein
MDALRQSFNDDLQKRLEERLNRSKQEIERNQVTQTDLDATSQRTNDRALLEGLTKASALIGSTGGYVADTSGISSSRKAFDQADQEDLANKKLSYNQALNQEQTALTGMEKLLPKEKTRRTAVQEFDDGVFLVDLDNGAKISKIGERNKKYEIAAEKNARSEARSQVKAEQAEEKTQKKEDDKYLERNVPGVGLAATRKDAEFLKDNVSSSDSAIDDLKSVIEMGRDVSVWDRERVGLIQQKLNQAVGKLRLSLTGPGAMTDSERQMIKESIGDPTKLTSKEDWEIAKLNQLIENIESAKKREIKLRTVNQAPVDLSSANQAIEGKKSPQTAQSKIVKVSNGKETLEIPESDLADAAKEGFRRIDNVGLAK